MHYNGLCLIVLIFAVAVKASRGDQSPWYRECREQCTNSCTPQDLSFFLRLLRWNCPADCGYKCMWAHAARTHPTVLQYHGKWPFVRLLGLQEPASVFFSIGNLWAQVRGYRRYRKYIDRHPPWIDKLVVWAFLANCNGWIWSAVFHARDLRITERLDYFSATWLVIYSAYFAICRLFGRRSRIFFAAFLLYYAGHVTYLHFVKFDYGYNMAVTAGFGLLFNASWIYMAVKAAMSKSGMGHYRKALQISILFIMAGCLELFDFPPIMHCFDAHSLWHAATIPLTLMWYDFLVEDARYLQLSRPHLQ